MNILYMSVHQILEDDEVRMFQELGHNVCCLGSNTNRGSSQLFRQKIEFNAEEIALYRLFDEAGGAFCFGNFDDLVLPEKFLDAMDVIIVMHEFAFISRHWSMFRGRVVVWRSIGQGVEMYDTLLQPYRVDGLKIVRYSPKEMCAPGSLGADALIRFAKDASVYRAWSGAASTVLTFANAFERRYPREAADYTNIIAGYDAIIGGLDNQQLMGAVGVVSADEQLQLYRSCGVYVYAHGLDIPYTLNFIEAWMTGAPLVVYAPTDRRGSYFEVCDLVDNGVNGFVCSDIDETRSVIDRILHDRALSVKISSIGRNRAVQLFSTTRIKAEWNEFLQAFE